MIIFGRKNKSNESQIAEEEKFLDKCTVFELRRIKKNLLKDLELYRQMRALREAEMSSSSEKTRKSAVSAIKILDQNIGILNAQLSHVMDELLIREGKKGSENSFGEQEKQ